MSAITLEQPLFLDRFQSTRNFRAFADGAAGEKAPLPFSHAEYERRLALLREDMAAAGQRACVFTSMHGVAYYSGFLYCALLQAIHGHMNLHILLTPDGAGLNSSLFEVDDAAVTAFDG